MDRMHRDAGPSGVAPDATATSLNFTAALRLLGNHVPTRCDPREPRGINWPKDTLLSIMHT
ncbi:hypothetical protein LBMAG46_14480 [Planctomycetia bacterium]|nr:hypothetical protein LBMAG46_14480 [Planctomycetia bacterium]